MKTTFFATTIFAALALAACNDTDNTPNPAGDPVAATITAGIEGTNTRAAGTAWDTDDMIGITATSTGATNDVNMAYRTTGDGAFAPVGGTVGTIFFEDAADVSFTAYYPFAGTSGTLPGTDGTIAGISTADQSTQKSFDFLYASGVTASKANPVVSFTGTNQFKHRMARLIIKVQAADGQGFSDNGILTGEYKLGGIRHGGEFNTTTGTATATGDPTDDWGFTGATPTTADGVRTYSMILFPQDLSAVGAAATITATVDGQTFANSSTIAPNMQPGMSYTYTITVKKTGIDVTGGTIAEWSAGAGGNGDATPWP